LLGEGHPGVVFVGGVVAADDIERDLEFLQGLIKAGALGAAGHFHFLAEGSGGDRVELNGGVEFLGKRAACADRAMRGLIVDGEVFEGHEDGVASGDFAVENFVGVKGWKFIFPVPDGGNFFAPAFFAGLAAGEVDDVPQAGEAGFAIGEDAANASLPDIGSGLLKGAHSGLSWFAWHGVDFSQFPFESSMKESSFAWASTGGAEVLFVDFFDTFVE